MEEKNNSTEQHLGIGKEYEFVNKEKHVVRPLGVEFYGHTIRLMNTMRKEFGDKPPEGDQILNLFAKNNEITQTISEMVSQTLNDMFPNGTKEELDAFASRNMFYLFQAVIEQNLPKVSGKDVEKASKIARLQKHRNESLKKNKKSE